MGLFDKIKHAIFGDKGPLGGQFSGKQEAPAAAPKPSSAPTHPTTQAKPAAQAAPPAPQKPVDVEAILSGMASKKGEGGNWHNSIVDLLKLLELDSSLQARKELAQELNIHAGADGSAEQNIALHKAVMKKLAESGGKVPADWQD